MGIEIPRMDSDCALCRGREANEVGSHLAPNFIIHKAFSFDGKGGRDREISYRSHLNDPWRPSYYGRSVSAEAIEADLGHPMTDEEIEANNNILVCDHLFCKDCEKWFGVLETEYARFYSKGLSISPRIAYLFWLSVFWRMSVGYMSILMDIHDELAIRKILQDNLLTKEEIEASDSDLGDFGFVVWHTDGIIKGDSGIFGTRTRHCPYIIILNDLVVALVKDEGKRHQIGYRSVSSDYVNSWADDDIYVGELSLEEFARMKRWIIDESKRAGFGKEREKLDRNYQEIWRNAGEVIEWATYKAEEEYARSVDGIYDGDELRNFYRFWGAELKAHAAARLGQDYRILTDRSLFLFKFDIENYKSDLLKYVRKGISISKFPYAAKLMPPKYIDRKEVESLDRLCEETIDDLLDKGFSFEDIIERNACTQHRDN